MSNKIMIAENTIIDLDEISMCQAEMAKDRVELDFGVEYRLSGQEKLFILKGDAAEVLWDVLKSNAAPLYAIHKSAHRKEKP